jgi:hypothetical protein
VLQQAPWRSPGERRQVSMSSEEGLLQYQLQEVTAGLQQALQWSKPEERLKKGEPYAFAFPAV